jgi:hypothetical protein
LYETLTNGAPRPFQWKFDREKLAAFLERLEEATRKGHNVTLQLFLNRTT